MLLYAHIIIIGEGGYVGKSFDDFYQYILFSLAETKLNFVDKPKTA